MAGRLVIAGTQSGVGKTTITVGLIDALRRRGLNVQPFKVGPDFIDPTYHTLAAGRPCRNLDTWMLPANQVKDLFARASHGTNLALIEGVMGLYDGSGYDGDNASTAEVARLLAAPVVLVVDAARLARSAAAVALGYQRFDDATPLAGFIINRAASANHGRGVAAAVEQATGLPVLGWLPREATLHLPERYLGLIPTVEPGSWSEFIHEAGDAVAQHLDLDKLLALSNQAQEKSSGNLPKENFSAVGPKASSNGCPVIGVARDEAFHFTYEDNLDLLRAAGADIAFFSPLRDPALPPRTAGVILSGGFPEVYAEQLSANRAMHGALEAAHRRGLPLYAECGGLMYLSQAIVDRQNTTHPMVGLLPGRCVMGRRLALGYRVARAAGNSWFLDEGETVRGHEFHYSAWEERPKDLPPAYVLLPRSGEGEARPEGARLGSLWASYVHVHFGAKLELAGRFAAACQQARKGGQG
jgi:cobyrinic acid a,c-diamide synthase